MADLRHGVATSVLANVNRDSKQRPEPYKADDFIYWKRAVPQGVDPEPVLLDDPAAQSKYMLAALFGKVPD